MSINNISLLNPSVEMYFDTNSPVFNTLDNLYCCITNQYIEDINLSCLELRRCGSRKAIGNFCLGFAIQNTELEGWSFKECAGYFEVLINHLENKDHRIFTSTNFPESFCNGVEQIIKAERQASPSKNAVKAVDYLDELKPGQSLVLPSGWVGHAIIVRIEKIDAETFNIFIYNSHEGLMIQTRDKQLCIPYFKFEKVTREELFLMGTHNKDASSLFFERLYAQKTLRLAQKEYELSDFLNLFTPFYHRPASIENYPEELLLSIQKTGGNCTAKTFRFFLLELLGNHKEYTLFDLEIRLFVLLCFYKKCRPFNANNHEDAFMLQQALMRFIAQVDEHQSIMSKDSYFKGIAIARKMLLDVNKALDMMPSKKTTSHEINYNEKSLRKTFIDQYTLTQNDNLSESSLISLNIDKHLGENASWNTLHSVLNNFLNYTLSSLNIANEKDDINQLFIEITFNANKKIEYSHSYIIQFEILIRNLKKLKYSIINDIKSFSELNEMIEKLNFCLYIYLYNLKSLYYVDSTGSLATQCNIIMETLALAYSLAIQADQLRPEGIRQGYLNNYIIDHELFKSIAHLPFFLIDDADTLKHRNELLQYFESFENKQPIFKFFNFQYTKNQLLEGKYPEAAFHLSTNQELQTPPNYSELTLIEAQAFSLRQETRLYELFEEITASKDDPYAYFYHLKIGTLWATGFFIHYLRTQVPALSEDNRQTYSSFLQSRIAFDRKESNPSFNYLCLAIEWSSQLQIHLKNFNTSNYDKTFLNSASSHFGKWVEDPASFSLLHHTSNKIPTENRRLMQNSTPQDTWMNDVCVPDAQISTLLQDLTHNIHRLNDKELRTYYLFFHKTVEDETNKTTKSPLVEQIVNDPEFLNRLIILLTRAIQTNNILQGDNLLILSNIATSLIKNYKKIKNQDIPIDLIKIIKNLHRMLIKKAKKCEQNIIDQKFKDYSIAAYSLLLCLPPNNLSKKNMLSCFFFLCQMNGTYMNKSSAAPAFLHKKQFLILLDQYIALEKTWRDYINEDLKFLTESILKKINNEIVIKELYPTRADLMSFDSTGQNKIEANLPNEEDYSQKEKADEEDRFGKVAANQNPSNLPADGIHCNDPFRYTIIDNHHHSWTLDFLNCILMTPQGPLTFKSKAFSQQLMQALKRLSISSTGLMSTGEITYLQHPHHGSLRIIDSDLQKYYQGEWYTYISLQDVLKNQTNLQLNDALTFDHALWLSTTHKKILFTDLQGTLLYETNEDGSLTTIDKEKNLYLSSYPDILSHFEDPNMIITWQNKRNNLVVSLPVYSSKLYFFTKEDLHRRLYYGKDSHYYIDEEPNQPHWEIDRCLHLIAEDGHERLVLIPQGTIQTNAFDRTCSIKLDIPSSDGSQGSRPYYEYEVEQGALEPKTPGARIYLAHIYLEQKKYQQSLEMIQGLSLSDTLSEEDWKLVYNMLKVTKTHSPKAICVRLRAYLHLLKFYPSEATLKKIDPEMTKWFEHYLESPLAREAGLKITEKEAYNLARKLRTSHRLSSNEKIKTTMNRELKLAITPPTKEHFSVSSFEEKQLYQNINILNKNALFTDLKGQIHRTSDIHVLARIVYRFYYDHRISIPIFGKNILLQIAKEKKEEIESKKPSKYFSDNRFFRLQDIENPGQKDPIALVISTKEEKIVSRNSSSQQAKITLSPPSIKIIEENKDEIIQENKDISPEQMHRNYYLNERNIAKEQAALEQPIPIHTSREALKDELSSFINIYDQRIEYYTALIREAIERPFYNSKQLLKITANARRFAHREGQGKHPPTLEDVCRAAADIKNSRQKLSKLNPALTSDEIAQLQQTVFQFMTIATERKYVNTILDKLNEQCIDQELSKILMQKRLYEPSEDPFLLFFEWRSGLRIRPKQKTLLLEAKKAIIDNNHHFIFQLGMSEGKSSVIFSVLLEIISNSTERVPCVITHHSQHASVMTNLKHLHKNRYHKDIVFLDATLDDLNDIKKIETLIERFKFAEKKGYPIIMRFSFPLMLRNKIIAKIAKFAEKNERSCSTQCFHLAKLFHLLLTKTVFILDEIDSLSSMLVDVRIPFGEKISFPTDEAELLAAAYQLFASSLKDMVDLFHNKQEMVTEDIYKEKIVPAIGKLLFSNPLLPFNQEPQHQDAFIRYLLDTIPAEDQDNQELFANIHDSITKENVTFLRCLSNLFHSNDPKEKRKAELVITLRYFLTQILPVALSQNYFRDHGPLLDQPDIGEIVPYNATGSQSPYKWGNPHLACSVHLQAVFCQKISKDEVVFLAKNMLDEASNYAELERKTIEATLEAQQFMDLTGVALTRLIDPETMMIDPEACQEAVDHINHPDNFLKKLALRFETFFDHLHIHAYEIYSTAIDLALISPNTTGGSGTMQLFPAFSIHLGKLFPDAGVDGKVLNRMISHNQTTFIKEKSLTSFLEMILQLPDDKKRFVGGLIDIAGFLKSEPNVNAAVDKIKDYFLQYPVFKKKGIVYLHRFDNGKEQFVLLNIKKGTIHPLDNTSNKKELLKYNIPLENIFFLWDELRTRGTDFPFPTNADSPMIYYATLDPSMLIRNAMQGYMRCRGYLDGFQDVQALICEKERPLFHNNAATNEDIAFTFIDNEARDIGSQAVRSYTEQLRSIITQNSLLKMIDLILESWYTPQKHAISMFSEIKNIFMKNKSFFLVKKNYFNYSSWMTIKKPIKTKLMLENYIADELKEHEDKRKEILNSIKNNNYLPEFTDNVQEDFIGQQVHVTNESNVMVNTENTNEELKNMEIQIQKELNSFQNLNNNRDEDAKETDWTEEWNEALPPSLLSAQEFLKQPFSYNKSTAEYAECFSENIYLTTNFRDTSKYTQLSVFDKAFKPIHFVLICRDKENKLAAILLSKFDKQCVQQHLQTSHRENAWLFNLQGLPEIEHASPLPDDIDLKRLIWQANFMNGNIDYLTRDSSLLCEMTQNKSNPLFGHFLLLKNAHNHVGFVQTIMAGLVKTNALHKFNEGHLFSYRRKSLTR